MKLVHSLILLLVFTPVVYARLGETESELFARFGQPKVRTKDQMAAQGRMWDVGPKLVFQSNDWHISCVLVDGRCAWISYGKPGEWTEEQLQLVLSSNSQGAKWTETTKGSSKLLRTWKRADGADARWHSSLGFQMVVPAYERSKQVIEARAKAAASQKPKI